MRQQRDGIGAGDGGGKVLDSQQSGATAVVTDEAQVPTMAETLSTSMSLRRRARRPRGCLVVLDAELDAAAEHAAGRIHSSTTARMARAMMGP